MKQASPSSKNEPIQAQTGLLAITLTMLDYLSLSLRGGNRAMPGLARGPAEAIPSRVW